MAGTTAASLRKLITSVAPAADGAASDCDLLHRFAREGDQAAFAALVRRHTPMVLGVCRRALPTLQDAEDACQATFLLLARKAKGGRWQASLANWLYGTARKVAANAQVAARRRARREAHAGVHEAVEPADMTARELLAALEEELDKLPPRYREPLVLCYLEGLTRDEAACRLGILAGTLRIRLERGRKKLHDALTRRGLGLGAGLLVLATTSQAGMPPSRLVESILVAASGRVPAAVAALAEGVSMNGFVNKSASVFLAAVTALAAGLVSVSLTVSGQPPDRAAAPQTERGKHTKADAAGERLPVGAVARLGSTGLRHSDAIFFATYTPDGKRLLTAGMDRTIRLWDLPTGKELRRFDCFKEDEAGPVHPSSLTVALSPNGQIVAAVRKGTLYLWEAATGKLLHKVATGQKSGYGGDRLLFAADSKALLTVSPEDRSALVWDVVSGKNTKRLAKLSGLGDPFAVSPDWKYLASVRQAGVGVASVTIKDLAADRELPKIPVLVEQPCSSHTLTFSADSKVLAWPARRSAVVLWDVGAHKERLRLDRKDSWWALSAIALSADGKSIALSHQDTIEIWDGRTGKRVASAGEEMGNESQIRQSYGALAFSPDARELVASFGGPSALRFNAASAERLGGPGDGHRDAVSLLGLSGDGKTVLTYCRRDPLRCWDLATGRQVRQAPIAGSVTGLPTCSADGQRLAASLHRVGTIRRAEMNSVVVYDGAGKALRQFDPKGGVEALALSPDGRVLAMRLAATGVRLWDTTTGKYLVTLAQTQGARLGPPIGAAPDTGGPWGLMTLALLFSPDGRYLIGGKTKRQLALWDSRTGETVWAVDLGREGATERFALSADGHALATLNTDGTVTLYEAATGQQRARLSKPGDMRGGSSAFAFSPDGRYLATAKGAPIICLWDLITGEEIGQLKGHQGNVVSLLFTPDSRRLISGSQDTTALTWDLRRLLKGKATPPAKFDARALRGLWTELAGKDATKAFAALRKLSASPAQAAALIKEQVRPVAPADPKKLRALIADLESDKFAVRQKAEVSLQALGELAEPDLRKALAGDPGPDLRQRLERLLPRLSGRDLSARLLGDLRAIELLELAGGADALRVLDELARGAQGARLTREAKAAAQRLAKRPASQS